jgi:hypothetical protein
MLFLVKGMGQIQKLYNLQHHLLLMVEYLSHRLRHRLLLLLNNLLHYLKNKLLKKKHKKYQGL